MPCTMYVASYKMYLIQDSQLHYTCKTLGGEVQCSLLYTTRYITMMILYNTRGVYKCAHNHYFQWNLYFIILQMLNKYDWQPEQYNNTSVIEKAMGHMCTFTTITSYNPDMIRTWFTKQFSHYIQSTIEFVYTIFR
jgi:hypothetical protein